MDHSTHVPLAESELTADILEGATVYGPDDDDIGTISHLHGRGMDAKAVVDVGGFLGIGSKAVAIPVSSLHFMRDEDGDVHATTDWSEDDLKALPAHHDLG